MARELGYRRAIDRDVDRISKRASSSLRLPALDGCRPPMTILYVYQGDWPRNATRVGKQTRSLAEAGHSVCLLAGNLSGAPPRRERNAWMEIRRLPTAPFPPLRRLMNFPLFVNPIWLWYMWRTARSIGAHCIIVRDLPLAPTALFVGRLLAIPVHYDMADVYPVMLRVTRADHPWLVSRMLRNPTAAAEVERQVVRRVATVFVVSEESRARAIAIGVPPDRAVLVTNTPANVQELARTHARPPDLVPLQHREIIIFVGNLLSDRGLEHAIEAMRIVARQIPEAALVIIGDGREGATLRRQSNALGLHEHVFFLGWKPHAEHAPYYAYARIGIMPYPATEHVCITIPNKVFDYMGAGLAMVASDVPPIRRILRETRSGVLVPPGDPSALAAAIVALLHDDQQRHALGENGRVAVATRYNWTLDAERLIAAIEATHRPPELRGRSDRMPRPQARMA